MSNTKKPQASDKSRGTTTKSMVDPRRRLEEYKARIEPLKKEILQLGEKNMENTIWVVRRWLRDEVGLINQGKNTQKNK